MERRFFLFPLLTLLLLLPLISNGQEDHAAEIDAINARGRNFANQGNFDEAEKAFLSILDIDSLSVQARNNLGIIYKTLGRYNDALRVYSEAEAIVKGQCGPLCPELALIYMNKGIVQKQMQDYELALQYLLAAENIINSGDVPPNTANIIYNNIGNIYFGIREWRKALDYYQKGIEQKLKHGAGGLDILYANCASAYEYLGRLDTARQYYELSIQTKIAEGRGSHQLISVYNNYSIILQKMGESEKARSLLEEALFLAHEHFPDKHPVISECYRQIGLWQLANNNPEEAVGSYQQAVKAAVFDFKEDDPAINPSPDSEIISYPALLEALMGKANALAALYRQKGDAASLRESLETLELANLLSEKMRFTYSSEESKLYMAEYARTGFEMAINTAYDLYKLTGEDEYAGKAFMYAEKSKSSVLLASLQELENKKNLGIPASLQNMERDLKSETDFYKKKLFEERQREKPDTSRLAIWQGKLLDLSQTMDSLNEVIRASFPEYASKYDNDVIGLREVMKGLDRNKALVAYTLSDTSLFTFTFTRESYSVSRTVTGPVFYENVDVLSRFLRNNDFYSNTIEDYRDYTGAAHELFRIFLSPVSEEVRGKDLIIIPDGELGYIPFEALLTELPDLSVMDYRTLPYLIYEYSITYSYSATLLFDNNDKDRSASGKLLAFAPTYEHVGDISSEKFPSFRNYSTYLVPLKFISTEIQNISTIMATDRYEGFNATEKVFREKAPGYDILHLAMHTLINDENPLYSQLVFSLNNDTLEANDGLLNAYEIFNMQLNARMVVLSACNTGYGKLRKGEGIMSMARGFIFAGVPSIIMTLWAVEDQSGSILMTKFYSNLVDGMRIDKALREAKLEYLAEADQLGAHPYLWSGYVSIGATDPLVEKRVGCLLPLILLSFALLVAIILFILYRRRKRHGL